jgi:hypothetical protein
MLNESSTLLKHYYNYDDFARCVAICYISFYSMYRSVIKVYFVILSLGDISHFVRCTIRDKACFENLSLHGIIT